MRHARHSSASRHRLAIRGSGLLVLVAAALAGCGGERLYPVRLDVRLADDSPAAGCSVLVMRTEPPEVIAAGDVAADGTCAPVVSRGGGLPPGTYRVAVSPNSGPPVDGPRKPPPFAERYLGHATSGLQFTVGPGQPAVVKMTLEK